MTPKFWPKRLNYARKSVSVEIAHVVLQHCLRSGNSEDFYQTSRVIEENCVHPHLQIKKITSDLKIDGLRSHPLAHKKTLMGHLNYGLFATEKIKIDTEIGEYVGEISIVNPHECMTVSPMNRFSEYVWVVKANNLFFKIDAQNIANELALVNDYRGLRSFPNVKMSAIIHKGFYYFGYVASLDIQKGEELLVDYGEDFQRMMAGSVRKY
jgi:hypothetical protein